MAHSCMVCFLCYFRIFKPTVKDEEVIARRISEDCKKSTCTLRHIRGSKCTLRHIRGRIQRMFEVRSMDGVCYLKAGERAQQGQCLLHKHENLNSDLPHPDEKHGKSGVVASVTSTLWGVK